MRVLLLLLFAFTLYADKFSQAETFFYNKEYAKALPLYLECVDKSKRQEAAYKIGWMYQNAKGVERNLEEATKWYKKSAELEVAKTKRTDFYKTLFSSMNPLSDSVSTNTAIDHISGKFSIRAHEANYMIVTYSDTIPKGEGKYEQNSPNPDPNGVKYINTELQYQISLKGEYVTDWFDFTQIWSAAYTQTSYWQIFINSAPFRETNYKPELYLTMPFGHKLDNIGLKGIRLGYLHMSNGQPVSDGNRTRPDGPVEGSRSRSWNRIYAQMFFQWGDFFGGAKIWHRVSEEKSEDDNPDIEDYYGQGELNLTYIYKTLLIEAKANPSVNKGLVSGELSASFPTLLSDDVYYYFQASHGYGSSLIDYDQKVSKVGFGISISR